MGIKLGQKVRDVVTGLEGIVTSRTDWIAGCVRLGVQPPAFKNGDGEWKVPDAVAVDEGHLEVLDEVPIRLPAATSQANTYDPKLAREPVRGLTGGGGRRDDIAMKR